MDKINCEIKLRLESNEKSPKDIIEYVKKLNKFEIDYGKAHWGRGFGKLRG